MTDTVLIIGIDGGATKVNAWQVVLDKSNNSFKLGEIHAEKKYSQIPGFIPDFTPVEIPLQLAERERKQIQLTLAEEQQGTVYVEACAVAIEKIVETSGAKKILIGLGMPGLKTEDYRGISALANGPRMPSYSLQLEKRLQAVDIAFVVPIHHLGSDADYCGIGENYSVEGLFRNCPDAYYLGGGTGVADAMKLNDRLVPFDQTKDWIAKTWELKGSYGRSLEKYISAGGVQSLYADLAGTSINVLNEAGIFPPQIAQKVLTGDKAAQETYAEVSNNMAQLIYSRITTLFSGWQNEFEFVNPNRAPLSAEHPYRGKLFQRIIIGQRLGDLIACEEGAQALKFPMLTILDKLIQNSALLKDEAKNHYRALDKIICTSNLREAPALGAGIDAFFSWQDFQ